MQEDGLGLGVDTGTLRVSLESDIAFSDVAQIADGLAGEFTTTEISRADPRRIIAGPGLEGIFITVAVSAAGVGVIAFAKQFFTRLADDTYNWLRKQMVVVSQNVRAKRSEPRPVIWSFRFERELGPGEHRENLIFSARGEDADDLRDLAIAASTLLAGLPPVTIQRNESRWWSWDTPSKRWLAPAESESDLATAALRVSVAEVLSRNDVLPLLADLSDHSWKPVVGTTETPAVTGVSPAVAVCLAVSYEGQGGGEFVRRFAGLIASDAYARVRESLAWLRARTEELDPGHDMAIVIQVGFHRFYFEAYMPNEVLRARLLAAQALLDRSPNRLIEGDDAMPPEHIVWYWHDDIGWRAVPGQNEDVNRSATRPDTNADGK